MMSQEASKRIVRNTCRFNVRDLIENSTQDEQMQLIAPSKRQELHPKRGLIYVELDANGIPVVSKKSMGLTCNKRRMRTMAYIDERISLDGVVTRK